MHTDQQEMPTKAYSIYDPARGQVMAAPAGSYSNATAGNAPQSMPLTAQIAERLKEALSTVERSHGLACDKHYQMFGVHAPSAPASINQGAAPEPEGFEANVRLVLDRLNCRLLDMEAATASLVNRL